MSDVLESIYRDAYNMALNSGATEEEASSYAQACRENTTEYLEFFI